MTPTIFSREDLKASDTRTEAQSMPATQGSQASKPGFGQQKTGREGRFFVVSWWSGGPHKYRQGPSHPVAPDPRKASP
jgi:hypothetical protein